MDHGDPSLRRRAIIRRFGEMMRIRSLLYLPGDRADLIAKVPRAGADVTVVDLEDAVAPGSKEVSWEVTNDAVGDIRASGWRGTTFLRVNGLDTRWWLDDILNTNLSLFDGIVIPKADSTSAVDTIWNIASAQRSRMTNPKLILGVENAAGVVSLANVVEQTRADLVGIYIGTGDLLSEVAGYRTPDQHETLYARSQTLLIAKSHGLVAIDQGFGDFRDEAGFREDARYGRALGFEGKICITPTQSRLANEEFAPSSEEAAYARRVLEVFEQAETEGRGGAVLDGSFINDPAVRRARRVLAEEASSQ